MQHNGKKNRRIYSAIFLFALLSIVFGVLPMESTLSFIQQPVLFGMIVSFLVTFAVIGAFLLIRQRKIMDGLKASNQLIQEIDQGNFHFENKGESTIPIIQKINETLYQLADDQMKKISELNQRTAQLDEKNAELNDAYMQMESSFGQLQAALEQLNDSEKRYHSLIVNIPDIVLTLNEKGNITYASRACKDVLEFRRPEIVGKPFQYIVHADADEAFDFNILRERVEKSGDQRIHILLRKKDGSPIQTEIKFTKIQESPLEGIQAIIRDVTEQKRMENALRENNRRLEILNVFSHKLASAMELGEIYKTCVNTVIKELGFHGCIYFITNKNERFYRIVDYSGEYFRQPANLEPFSYIHRNAKALSNKDSDGIILNADMVPQYLVMNQARISVKSDYHQAYIQELRLGGESAGLIIVLAQVPFLTEEIDVLRSIGHTTVVAVENTMHLIESRDNYVQTIDALIAAIEAKDQYTRGHSQRVSGLAVKIANRMGMAKQQVEELRIAGILHDIGKIGISDSILLKKGPLTKEEYEEIKKHPAISNKILYPIGLSDRILKAVAFHHERFDGRGYPFGLTNESLGLEPQIIAVADAFDAMTSSRPYRNSLSWQMAVMELERNKGSQFHPDIVEILVQIQMDENAKMPIQ